MWGRMWSSGRGSGSKSGDGRDPERERRVRSDIARKRGARKWTNRGMSPPPSFQRSETEEYDHRHTSFSSARSSYAGSSSSSGAGFLPVKREWSKDEEEPAPAFSKCVFSGGDVPLNYEDIYDDFVNVKMMCRFNLSEMLIQGLLRTNPVAKTSVDSGLSPAGLRQAARAALELRRLGACEDDCWIWPSITQRAYQAAEIIAAANSINRRCLSIHIVVGYEYDPSVYASDNISPDIKPPPTYDGTPNESVADVFVRVTRLMSILETQYSGDTVVIVSPDSDNLSILQAGLIGLDLRRHDSLFFQLGEVRAVDPASIPEYKQPASKTCILLKLQQCYNLKQQVPKLWEVQNLTKS
ncbi:unnamed protein product [Triticum turgidum subsp. durum]|uniref:Uncharacterized protein n=1 Tax=Triticum turgidum subsp. durum TaxID=4567 RepID=A0A9R0RKJ5_TRITD|nr:unnamed protein product [Triticum turgidum subsp. durum]